MEVIDNISNSHSGVDNLKSESEQKFSVSSFWFCTFPAFSTRILFTARSKDALAQTSVLEIFDCDGELVNEAKVSFEKLSLGILDLDPLVSACKLESGLKHGHVRIKSAQGVSHQCRIESLRGSGFLSSQREVQKRRDIFFPLFFSPDRSNFLALVNQSNEESEVRARVFCGSRTPKYDFFVPAAGSRVIQLESVFPEYGYLEEKRLKAYVRLSLRSGGTVACSTFDRVLVQQDQDQFRAVS